MSMGSEVLVLTCTMADVGNTKMCVQDVSWGVLNCDVCMLRVVLRPNTEPVDTESAKRAEDRQSAQDLSNEARPFSFPLPGMMTKEPCGSIATRQALRILGVSAAEMPHILHVSFRRLLRDCRFLLLSRILQSGTTALVWVHGGENVWRTCSRAKRVYLAARRGPFYPAARWPPSMAETSPAPDPGTSPRASAGQPVWRCHFSCELCENTYSSIDAFACKSSSAGVWERLSLSATCWGHLCWWCRSPVAPRAGQCRKPAASVDHETDSSPQTGRCTFGKLHQRSRRALSACLSPVLR